MMPTAATALHWLDVAFAFWVRCTVQVSLVVLLILAARAALRGRLAPGARYALWLLLAFPLVAPLLPLPALPLPATFRAALPAAPPPPPSVALSTTTPEWRVEYGPIGIALPTTPAHPTAALAEPINWLRWAAVAWIAIVTVLALRMALMHARAVLAGRRCRPVSDEQTLSLLNECGQVVGTRRLPRLVISPAGTGPALLGVLRPRLLLPDGSHASLSRDELRFVFLHELVHLKRGDVFGELLLALLQIAQWFNPLVWLAAARCRADREIACDAAVLALTGDARRCDYGKTILRLATEVIPQKRTRFAGFAAAAAVGILENRTPLERRLRMIASTPTQKPARWPAAVVALATFALVAGSNAQTPAGKTTGAPYTSGSKDSGGTPAKLQANTAAADEKTRASADPNTTAREPAKQVAPEAGVNADDAAMAEMLGRRLPEVSFDGVGLTDVIDFLRDLSGANVFVNWKALKAAGIDPSAPVTARLRNVRFDKALQILLDGAAGAGKRLAFKADRGVITISTADDLRTENSSIRVYDVHDLIVSIPNYTPDPMQDIDVVRSDAAAAAKPPPPAEKVEADAKAARQQYLGQVIKLIQETVDPDAWGKTAQLRELEGQLIVSAPADLHEALARLLAQLRETRSIQVLVETRFVAVDDAVLDALPAGLRETVAGELRAAKDPVAVAEPKPIPPVGPAAVDPAVVAANRAKFALLDEKQVDQLMRAVEADKKSVVVSAPKIMLFNGQWAYVLTLNQRAYVADYTTEKQPNGSVKYEPLHGVVKSGLMLRAQATASADRKFATLSLVPRLTHLDSLEEVPWDRNPPGEKLTVRRPRLLASELSTTVNIADGQTLLLGGLKGYIGEGANQPGGKATPVLMLVKPKVIQQRELEQRQFPLLNGREEKSAGPGEATLRF